MILNGTISFSFKERGHDMNSFITWIGGKKLLRKEIIARFPEERLEKYVEVFGGAGWVLFYQDKYAEKEIYNDLNSELVNLFRMVKHHPKAVMNELSFLLNSREMFQEMSKNTYLESMTEIQRAARFYFLIRESYGGKISSFGCQTRNVLMLKDMEQVQKRLSSVLIENLSYEELIKRQDGSGTLFYCDPPYYGTEQYYGKDEAAFGREDHVILRNLLANIKGRVVLSYNDHPVIRELYQDFRIEAVKRCNNLGIAAGGEKKYKELIIRNY